MGTLGVKLVIVPAFQGTTSREACSLHVHESSSRCCWKSFSLQLTVSETACLPTTLTQEQSGPQPALKLCPPPAGTPEAGSDFRWSYGITDKKRLSGSRGEAVSPEIHLHVFQAVRMYYWVSSESRTVSGHSKPVAWMTDSWGLPWAPSHNEGENFSGKMCSTLQTTNAQTIGV